MKKSVTAVVIIGLILILGVFVYFGVVRDQNSTKKTTNVNIDYQTKPKGLLVSGFGGYKLEKIKIDNEEIPLIKIPLVTWGGYAALFAANNGYAPNKDSLFYKYGKFVVELVRDEDPNSHIQNFALGNYPIIWSTMDMLPLIYDTLKADKRVIPQVFGIFDWSFGGDGIIVRQNIKTPKDLKGKKVVTSGNTPSNFFLLWLIAQSGLTPSDVVIQYVDDAIAAKDAFIKDSKIDACVTWSPFLYEITDQSSKSYVDGTRLLITSKDANQLIGDCYLTRLDFLKDHPDIVENFSRSMMAGVDLLKNNSQKTYNDMASLFKLSGGPNEAYLMTNDVHIANFPENQMFFSMDNSISAYKIFLLSMEYYKNLGSLSQNVSYEPEIVINSAIIDKIAKTKEFSLQTNNIKNSFNQQGSFNIADLESKNVVLTENLQIYFDPQRVDFDFEGNSDEIKKNKQYLKKIAEQMNVLGTTVLKLVGHIDTTKINEFKSQGQQVYIEASAQAKLISKKRAEFIKKLLIEKYNCDKERIFTEGKGWDMPVDNNDQSLNRRVEVKFFSFE